MSLLCSATVTLDSLWLSVNHKLDGSCLMVHACFILGRIPAGDGDFLSALLRVHSMEEREDQKDRLDFVRNQLNILTEDTKEKIKRVTEEVENKVSNAKRTVF